MTDELDDTLDENMDDTDFVPLLPEHICKKLAEVNAPRRTGKTTAMMMEAAGLAGHGIEKVLIIGASGGHARALAERFAALFPAARGDTAKLRLEGTHFWFCTLATEAKVAAGLGPCPRYVDHWAVEEMLRRVLEPTR